MIERIKKHLNDKYTEAKFVFDSNCHRYYLDEIILPSITGFISIFSEPFDAIKISQEVSENENSKYFNLSPEFIRKIWNLNGNRGTKKHEQIENWFLQKISDAELPESVWFKKNNLTPDNCLPEVRLFSKKYLLAGTADLVKIVEKPNQIYMYVYDFKTSVGILKDPEKLESYSKQIVLYSIMLSELMSDFEVPILVKPKNIIQIEPLETSIDKLPDIHDLSKFYKPRSIEINKNQKLIEDIKYLLNYRTQEISQNISLNGEF